MTRNQQAKQEFNLARTRYVQYLTTLTKCELEIALKAIELCIDMRTKHWLYKPS